MKKGFIRYRPFIVAAVLVTSVVLWGAGLLQSPIRHPEVMQEPRPINRYTEQNTANLKSTRALAEAYWKRYRDVRESPHYGENGTMGIYGPEEHYKNHGHREGRVFGPVPVPDDPLLEPELAEAYWRRYPDIEKSAEWGRRSALGILGPGTTTITWANTS